jgi:hypothetical protein
MLRSLCRAKEKFFGILRVLRAKSNEAGRRGLFEDVVLILPATGIANRKDSTDRTFRLVHVHNFLRHHRHDAGDVVKNRLTHHR